MNRLQKGFQSWLFFILTIVLCMILAFALIRGISTGVHEVNQRIDNNSQAN